MTAHPSGFPPRPAPCEIAPYVKRFLEHCERADYVIDAIAGDASPRRYYRASDPVSAVASYIVMDASHPDEREKLERFIFVDELLRNCGLKSPDIYAQDKDSGLLLLEDLGRDSFNVILGDPASGMIKERELYIAATECLLQLRRFAAPSDLEEYTEQLLFEEMLLLPQWYATAVLSAEEAIAFDKEFRLSIRRRMERFAHPTPAIVLRDYHADNLMWLPANDGVKRVGQLDFQDAIIGSGVYDLVSLLEDVRRAVSPVVSKECREFYRSCLPEHARATFEEEYAFYHVQRNFKILGIFARLAKRDHKPKYARMLPVVWNVLRAALDHPSNKELAALMDRYFPSSLRSDVPESLIRT